MLLVAGLIIVPRLRGQLEQIDYTAFACNREVVARTLGHATREDFQALALAAAQARADWVAAGQKAGRGATDAKRLGELRALYEELREVYEGARRMVERGYLPYEAPAAA